MTPGLCVVCGDRLPKDVRDREANRHNRCQPNICECPPPREVETFWAGLRQCGTCKKPFLEDLTPS